jgi:hypothetical protein
MGYHIEAPKLRLKKAYIDLDQRMALNGRETREEFQKVRSDQENAYYEDLTAPLSLFVTNFSIFHAQHEGVQPTSNRLHGQI